MISGSVLRTNVFRTFRRFYTENSATGSKGTVAPPKQANMDVPGLSSAVVHPTSHPVGPGVDPGKSGAYKVPEYFCYDNMSFFEAEIEMSKFRCPQPSALKK